MLFRYSLQTFTVALHVAVEIFDYLNIVASTFFFELENKDLYIIVFEHQKQAPLTVTLSQNLSFVFSDYDVIHSLGIVCLVFEASCHVSLVMQVTCCLSAYM
jgi:hypothetical protein